MLFVEVAIGIGLACFLSVFFFFQAEDGIRDYKVTGVQTCALPIFDREARLTIEGGRHPVVERFSQGAFVPNDLRLDAERRMLIITGPNMGGKSTYMRQAALIALLAHMGSYVPAERAVLGPIDRIFTRIGAADDLAGGRSTFMVEMTEAANILHNATARSLILLDEDRKSTRLNSSHLVISYAVF